MGVPLRDERRLFELLIGPTICYALIQSAGLVDDHLTSCFRHGAAAAQAIDKTASS
jgi:DNA-3-methyladenine glycosylase I